MEIKAKNFGDSFLYKTGGFENTLLTFMMNAEIINKDNPSFEDIMYEVKRRQVTSSLMKVLMSNNVILLKGNVGLSRAFKVFAAKDILSRDKKTKVFIDVTGVIDSKDGEYSMQSRNADILVSHLLNAMNTLIYYSEPNRLVNNSSLVEAGTKAFADMFTYIIDYLRVGGVDNVRERTKYMAAMYYQTGLLLKEQTESTRARARKLAGLNQRECDIIETLMGPEPFKDINTFIIALCKVLRIDGQLKLDIFIEKWMHQFGTGTQYGTELYPCFASMLTNAYVGSYINNQKTIEKVLGRSLVDFTNTLFKVGGELV